jgi:hypothetical protein
MVMQAVIATKRLEELSSKSLQQRKVWSELPTSPYLVTTAEDILLQQTRRYNQYSVVRVADDEFEVNVLKDQDEYQEEDQLLSNEASDDDDDDDHAQQQDTSSKWCPPIPRFMRTRTVKWDDEGRFYECSCCHFERTGIPCIHIYAVVKMLDPDWKGFTHHDVSVRWWSAYISHGFRGSASHNDDEDEEAHHSSRRLSTRLGNLADCDAKGPSVRSLPAPMFVDVGFPITGSRGTNVPAFCRVKNYPMDALHEIFGKAGRNLGSTETNLDMGLTQTTFDPDNSDDDDDSNDGVCNLFKDSLKQIAASDATLVLEDQMRAVEGHFKRIASLFPIVDTQGRDSAVTAISSIVSQLEDLVHEKENGKRNSSGGGTQGVVLERHNAKRRMYNTHNDYYR